MATTGRISTQAFSIPEEISSMTPTPVMMDPRMPDRSVHIGSSTFLTAIAIILGIVISVGTILSVVGKAFYVERDEYNKAVVAAAEERTKVTETLKQLQNTITRQELAQQKLSDEVSTLRQEQAVTRGRCR